MGCQTLHMCRGWSGQAQPSQQSALWQALMAHRTPAHRSCGDADVGEGGKTVVQLPAACSQCCARSLTMLMSVDLVQSEGLLLVLAGSALLFGARN